MIEPGRRTLSLPPFPTAAGRLGAVAPVPFVGLAAILIALIVFTPVLLAAGPSPLAVQAELEVYRTIGSSSTEFDVHGIDPGIPYQSLDLWLGTGFSWTGTCPDSSLNWTYVNETNEAVVNVLSSSMAVVVNATAVYNQGGTRAVYSGEIAFAIDNFGGSNEAIRYAPCPWTPSVSSSGSWAVSQGSLPLPLVNYGPGGHP